MDDDFRTESVVYGRDLSEDAIYYSPVVHGHCMEMYFGRDDISDLLD